jgi:phosphatidylserine/phosphatidylglycerophosphate/cardiolipin synthase-like enzyme
MAKTTDRADKFVSQVSLVGHSQGAVKNLAGFRKPHHTVPDAVNAVTTAFLGKLCTSELAEEGEDYYQRAKAALGYKRTDLTLDVSGPAAVLAARDFTLEIEYALDRSDPAAFRVSRTLHSLRSGHLVELEEFDSLFAGVFSTVAFSLVKGVKVEAVIDAVEARPEGDALTVTYPSDCRHCILAVAGVAAEVFCDGAVLEMRFPRAGSPREMVAAFREVRSAFSLAKDRVLSGLL